MGKVTQMDKEDSINLAENLRNEYAGLATYEIRHEECKAEAAALKPPAKKEHSLLYHFWPNILIAAAVYFIIAKIHETFYLTESFGFQLFLVILRLGAPCAVILLGILYSLKLKQNESILDKIAHKEYSLEKAMLEYREYWVRKRIALLKYNLKHFEKTIPEELRNADAMVKVLDLLKNGEVNSFEQAIEMLSKK